MTLVTDIEVIVNNVQQSPFDGSYSLVNNGLGLQFSENVSAGTNNIYVIYRDQPMGSLIDPTAVRKTGDTMTGTLTVAGNILAAANPGGGRVYGVSGGTNTTVVIQSGAAVGSGPNLELDANHIAYLDSNTTQFRSTDGSTLYGKFDSAGRFTVPNQPSFFAYKNNGGYSGNLVVLYNGTNHNIGNCYSTSTGRFTAPVAGRYLVCAFAISTGSGGTGYWTIRKNGNALAGADWSGSNYVNSSATAIVDMAVGDYFDVQNLTGSMYGSNSNENCFMAQLLG